MAEETIEQSMNIFVKNLLNIYFEGIQDKIEICICEKILSDENGTNIWKCLSGNEVIKKNVENCLKRNSNVGLEGKYLKTSKYYIMSIGRQEKVEDSRLSKDGKELELKWLFLTLNKSESFKFLMEILRDELENKFSNMILIEEVIGEIKKVNINYLNDMKEVNLDYLKESKIIKHYFKNLLDKEWLINRYIEKALKTYGLPDWKFFIQLSAMTYEKRIISTKLYFSQKSDYSCKIEFVNENDKKNANYELSNSNQRNIRKIMELSGKGHGLLIEKSAGKHIIKGIIEENRTINKSEIFININDHLVWSLNNGDEEIFEYRKGEYTILKCVVGDSYENEIGKLKELNLERTQLENIKKTISLLRDYSVHGMAIVFMSDDLLKCQIDHLARFNRLYEIKEIPILGSESEILGMTSIDGAILADFEGKCRGIGAILDGKAVVKGNMERGARYNSVVNYITKICDDRKKANKECFAAIISEDGMVNIEFPQKISLAKALKI